MKQIGVFLGIVIVGYIIATTVLNLTSSNDAVKTTAETEVVNATVTKEDLVAGTGEEASTGDSITVNYVGTLTNGKQFDSSYGKEPFTFTLGAGEVIKGWDEGVAGMKVGGKRKLTIPSELGYGNVAQGEIPASSDLVFEVELLEVKKTTTTEQNPDINL